MPFTLAHPIAAAPLWFGSQRKLDLPSLLLGTMIPDLQYFIALKPTSNIGHSAWGIAIQGIPCSIALLLTIRYVMRRPLLTLLPIAIAKRIPRQQEQNFWKPSHWLNIIASVATGAISHIFWDAFTHEEGWFVSRWAGLQLQVATLPVYKWLQYSGGVLGLFGLAIWLHSWLRRRGLYPRLKAELSEFPAWKGMAMACIILGALFFGMVAAGAPDAAPSMSGWVVRAVISVISGLCLSLGVYAMIFWGMSYTRRGTSI